MLYIVYHIVIKARNATKGALYLIVFHALFIFICLFIAMQAPPEYRDVPVGYVTIFVSFHNSFLSTNKSFLTGERAYFKDLRNDLLTVLNMKQGYKH